MRMTSLGYWRASCCIFVVASLACLPARADDGGCAGKVLRRHLEALPGWSMAAVKVGAGGAQVALRREGGGRTLMLALGYNEGGLNTFQTTYGEPGRSGVDPELSEQLMALYEAIDADPAVKACASLRIADAPVPDLVYKELEAMFRGLHVKKDEGGGGLPVVPLAVAGAALLVGIGVYLSRRGRRAAAGSAPEPASEPASVTEPVEPADGDAEDRPS